MFSKLIRLVALPLVLLHAGSALALVDVQALVGKRWYELAMDPKQKVSATEIALAAHIDPIPLVPVSFGVRAATATLNTKQLKSYYGAANISTGSMTQAGLDIMAWVPMIPFVTPYARLSLPVWGMWKEEGSKTDPVKGTLNFVHNGRIAGAQLSIGVKYAPLPLFSLLLEVNRAAENWKETDAKVDGVSVKADSKTRTLNSNAVLVGVEVGL